MRRKRLTYNGLLYQALALSPNGMPDSRLAHGMPRIAQQQTTDSVLNYILMFDPQTGQYSTKPKPKEYAIEFVVEFFNAGSATWDETMRTQDQDRARLHFKERAKNFPHSRWRLSQVQLLEFQERIGG